MLAGLIKRKSREKRSPLTASPLRSPGQSIDEEIQRIIDEKIDEYAAWGSIFIGLMLFEWARAYFAMPPQPIAFTIVGVIGGGYTLVRIWMYQGKLRSLRQARDGEKAVGQYLEALREKGYRVFHDIVGKGFNIDHALIGPAGVFSIETKTISKPVKGQSEVSYDGQTVRVNGFTPDRDPVVQAKAQASWLIEFIKESTGKTPKVRPVVLYPGWYISPQPKGAQVWVLNPKSLPAFLEHEDVVLGAEDVKLIAYHLSRYIRESCKKA